MIFMGIQHWRIASASRIEMRKSITILNSAGGTMASSIFYRAACQMQGGAMVNENYLHTTR